jgi:hypothetical protein
MTPLLPSDTEQLIPASAAVHSRPREQSSCPEPEKYQDVSGTPLNDIPQVAITSMHYVSLFDMY